MNFKFRHSKSEGEFSVDIEVNPDTRAYIYYNFKFPGELKRDLFERMVSDAEEHVKKQMELLNDEKKS